MPHALAAAAFHDSSKVAFFVAAGVLVAWAVLISTLGIRNERFVTAGVHIGQFSDFPLGLQPHSVVPANYGDLNGVNRTTARFPFAITYQTKKFNAPSSTPTTSSTTASKQASQ